MIKSDLDITPENMSAQFKMAQEYLTKAAVEIIHYIAMGNAFKEDLMKAHGLTEQQAKYLLAVVADKLARRIRKIKTL